MRYFQRVRQSNAFQVMEAGENLPSSGQPPDVQPSNQELSNARSPSGHNAPNRALHSGYTSSSGEAPNISLNVHGGTRNGDLYIVAACGVVLQFGVLILSGLAVYYPGWNLKFKKDRRPVQDYAYPLMAAGTLVLATGMIICSAVIEKSTAEVQWVVGEPLNKVPARAANPLATNLPAANTNLPVRDAPSADAIPLDNLDSAANIPATSSQRGQLKAHILWLQKKHTCSDQSFESYVIFAKGSREAILESRRRSPGDIGQEDNQQPTWWSRLKAAVASNSTEGFTLLGAVISLIGFGMQFQGLRGLNWTASISQLVAVFTMTMFRAWLRRGLVVRPIAKEVLDGCEMDWLALRIAKDNGIWRYVGEDKCEIPSDTPSYHWTVITSPKNFACQGSWAPEARNAAGRPRVGEGLIAGEGQTTTIGDNTTNAQKAVRVRQRLGHLMKWVGPASKPAISVAAAIAEVMNTFVQVDGNEREVFYWFLEVEVGTILSTEGSDIGDSNQLMHFEDGRTKSRIKFKVRYTEKCRWMADATEIEAALSLWICHIREREQLQRLRQDKNTGDGKSSDWLQENLSLKTKTIRLLGPDTENLKRDLQWWIGDVGEFIEPENPNDQPLGFIGLEPKTTVTSMLLRIYPSGISLTDSQTNRTR